MLPESQFAPVPLEPADSRTWGNRASHYLGPQTTWARRFSLAIERAWEATTLAKEVIATPDADSAGLLLRRATQLADDETWLSANAPEEATPTDTQIIEDGWSLIDLARAQLARASIDAMKVLDSQIRESAATAHELGPADLELLKFTRDAWAESLAELVNSPRPNPDASGLIAAMRETVDQLNGALS